MRRLALAACLVAALAPAAGRAQQPVPPGAAASPPAAALARARQWLAASGLTPAQVRARLSALGYPPNLLDEYLTPGASAAAGPRGDVLAALQSLGYADPELAPAADSVAGAAGALRADLEAEPQGPRIFGLDLFRRVTTQFQPALAGPVDETYRLGPGDVLVLILTGDVELAHTLEVTREGFVVIPQVGQLHVSGLTLAQLETLLYGRLGRVYSGVRRGEGATTRFQVTVARLRTVQVYVVGDVRRPGAYQVSSAGTALTALYLAGGPTERGSLRRILVRRGARADTLDLYDYLLRGDASRDRRLETGDVIFVPVRELHVEVAGAVTRPAIYELRAGETLRDLIGAAGGFDPSALRRRIQIDRILPPGERGEGGRDRVLLDIAAGQLADSLPPAVPLAAGDRVTVFSVADRLRRSVTVHGNVWTEGPVGLTPGMRLSDAIRLAGGPKPDVYLEQILISRLNPDSTRVQLRAAFRDSAGAVAPDLVLAEDDDIQVFSRTAFRPERYVVVTGAVRRPGRIPYREGMTLRDAVLQASGLTEDAWLTEAEIARLPRDRAGGSLAATLRVPLDSTYLFDRGPDGRYLGPPGAPAPAGGAQETPLAPYDNVLILRQPDWELHRTVRVAGQVRFPGQYTLRSKTDRLTDLIERAGGLTPEAYARGAELYRRLGPAEQSGLRVVGRLEAQRADSAPPVPEAVRLGTALAQRVGLDLARALDRPGARENLILQAGDSLYIPEFRATVQVLGAVNAPTTVIHREGWNLDRYVAAAGGFSQLADRNRSYVVQPGGKLESVKRRLVLPDGKPSPLPGAVVVVPERDPSDRKDWAGLLGSLAQILASTVAIVVVATR